MKRFFSVVCVCVFGYFHKVNGKNAKGKKVENLTLITKHTKLNNTKKIKQGFNEFLMSPILLVVYLVE